MDREKTVQFAVDEYTNTYECKRKQQTNIGFRRKPKPKQTAIGAREG